MDQSSVIHDSNVTWKFIISFSVVGFILVLIFIYWYCYRKRSEVLLLLSSFLKDENSINDRASKASSIESFEQLYFSKVPFNQIITNVDQPPTIERWSSIDQPSMTFYRVYMQDNADNFYQPVTEKRLHTAIEQSKAMEYVGLEMTFF